MPRIPEGYNSSELALQSEPYVNPEIGKGKVRDMFAIYPDFEAGPGHYLLYAREANGHAGQVYVKMTAADMHDWAQWVLEYIPTPGEVSKFAS